MISIFKRSKPFDQVIIIYCFITGIYILLGQHQLNQIAPHLLIRIVFIMISLFFIQADNTKNKGFLFLRNFYPLLMLIFFYSETDYYNNLIFENLDPYIIKLEYLIFGSHLSLKFSALMPERWFSELMYFGYFSYYLMTFGIPLLFYIKKRNEFPRIMFMTIFSFCLYYMLFFLFPTVGPQFYFPKEQQVVPEGYFFQQFMDFIIKTAETETGAFPSSHVGITTLFILVIFKHFKKFLPVLVLFSSLLFLSTVYIKAHYAIDVVAGIISGILFYYLSKFILNRYYP